MKVIKQQIEELEGQMEQLAEVREDVLMMKADINISALGNLLTTLKDGVDELLEGEQKKQYYDKELCGTLKTTVEQLVSGFSKLKPPTINVAAPSIDLSPLKSIASDITNQNNKLISLIEKFSNGEQSGELYRLITAMIGKQNIFLEKGFEVSNYTKQLDKISEGVNKNPVEWNGTVTKWSSDGRIREFNLKPKI